MSYKYKSESIHEFFIIELLITKLKFEEIEKIFKFSQFRASFIIRLLILIEAKLL